MFLLLFLELIIWLLPFFVILAVILSFFLFISGPVFIELPLDVLYPYKLVKKEMKIPDNPKGFTQRMSSM